MQLFMWQPDIVGVVQFVKEYFLTSLGQRLTLTMMLSQTQPLISIGHAGWTDVTIHAFTHQQLLSWTEL